MHVNPWARFIFWALVLLLSFSAFGIEMGKAQGMGISVCITKEDAVKVLTLEKKSKEEADAFFTSSPNCDNIGLEFTPLRVVATVKTPRGIGRIVEIKSGEAILYWITYRTLKGHTDA